MASLNRTTLRLWISQTKKYWLGMGAVFACTVLANSALLGIPIGYKHLTDGFINQDYHSITLAIWLIIGFELLSWLFYRSAEFIDSYVETNIQASLLRLCFTAIHQQPQHFFEDNLSGSIARRVNQYTEGFTDFYEQIVWNSTATIVSLVGAAIILGKRHWIFAAVLITWGIVFALITWRTTRYKQRYDIIKAATDSAATGHLNDTLSNQLAVRTARTLTREEASYKKITHTMALARRKSWLIDVVFDGTTGMFMIIVEAALLYLAMIGFQRGVISVSDIVMIQAYVIVIINQYWYLSRFFRRQYESFADAKGMTEVFISQAQHAYQSRRPNSIAKGAVLIDAVTFGYNEQHPVLRNLSLAISAGERVALVGPSGGGKSTIFKLLLNLYQPTKGTISVHSDHIAFVSQDPQLFHRSIKENIRYARPRATDAEIISAAKAAQADKFIKALPKGYNTLVGERGVKLSGGERQRIALARAFLQNAPIVLLDEPTSSLDSLSEQYIQKALAKLMVGRTVIVIAHRLTTINQMDRIYVIERGRVTESGTHSELRELRQGTYQRLWEIQTTNNSRHGK